MKLINISTPKHPNTFVKVDDEDFDFLSQWKWYAAISGKERYQRIYAARNSRVKGKPNRTITMHIQLMSPPKGMACDHINGDKLDNRRENLRVCTYQQNSMNMLKPRSSRSGTPTSQYKGVYFCKSRRTFVAMIKAAGVRRNLGRFALEIDAAKAYDNAAIEAFGEYAQINGVT